MAEILIGNVKGPQGIQGPIGPRGLQGVQGPQGPSSPLANNGITTATGFALDARYGKTLQDQLNHVAGDIKVKRLTNGTDIFTYANSLPPDTSSWYRVMRCPNHPADYGSDNDLWFHILKMSDPKYWRITAYDVRSNRTFSAAKINDVIGDWKEL